MLKVEEEANTKVNAALVAVRAAAEAMTDIKAVTASRTVDVVTATTITITVIVAKVITVEAKARIMEAHYKDPTTKAMGTVATSTHTRLL